MNKQEGGQMERIVDQSPPFVETDKNWPLIFFRMLVIALIMVCCYCNITDIIYFFKLVMIYMEFTDCQFTKFQVLVIATNSVMIGILIFGIFLVVQHKLQMMRIYLPFLFAVTWVQMMIIIVLIERYPLVHIIHDRWSKSESLAELEAQFECCGVFGPDDYLLRFGHLPRSCFEDGVMQTKHLRSNGCLTKDNVGTSLVRKEMFTPFFQFVLIFVMIWFYFYLKKIKAPVRTFRDLWNAFIFL